MMSLNALPQSWESIRDSEDYLYGTGSGATQAEAEKQAMASLVSLISSHVTAESHRKMELSSLNGQQGEKSQFSHSASTFSYATLTNIGRKVLKSEPDAHVACWIKKTEIRKIFEQRKNRILNLVTTAEEAEKDGRADDVLRNYYWALTLLKTLQYPNEVEYKDGKGHRHVLTNWIKERMNETFRQLKSVCASREGNDVRLYITYKGKPVNTLEYRYWDGQDWSAINSAKDGWGVVELTPGFDAGGQLQLKYEYEFAGEALSDQEIESVLLAVRGTPMPKAQTSVALVPQKDYMEKRERSREIASTFTSTDLSMLKPPRPMGKEAKGYAKILEEVVQAIIKKNYFSVRSMFTDTGWDMFEKLIHYGRAKVLDSSDIRFFEDNGMVVERGLRMAFSFSSGVKKSFVEDVVLKFDSNQKIDGIAFGLGKTAEDDILNKGAWDENSRFAIMNFLENYKTAYALKRLDYIKSVFDDDAVIITGTVIRKAPNAVNIENRLSISQGGNLIIKRNRQTKDQYLKNLERCFKRNEFVNIRFSNNDVVKLGSNAKETYAIQIAQDYYSSTYGDKGYLMLMVDVNDPKRPMIKLRTWQPEKDPSFGPSGLYEPGDF